MFKDNALYFTHVEFTTTTKNFFKQGFGPRKKGPKPDVFTECPKCGVEISSLNAFRQHNQKKGNRKTPICYSTKDAVDSVYYILLNKYLETLEQHHPAQVFNACLDDIIFTVNSE